MSLEWASPWNVILFRFSDVRWWLGSRKGIRPIKSGVLVSWWWRFNWRFTHLIAPFVTTTYIIVIVSVRVNPVAVRRRLTSSTTFCIHGWSSGASYAALNHRRPCFRCLRSTCMEQSSSRSTPIPDIYYFQSTPEVTSVQLILPSVWLYHWLYLYRALEAACAAYASLTLSLLHYITLHHTFTPMQQ